LLERLQAWGVQRVFGYPGDGINGVFGALPRAEDAAVVRQTTKQSVLDLLPGRG
jgi:pyruvate dehydrogenase (quinone)